MTLGADDFVPKPYSPRVLVAHIQALLRRAGQAATPASTIERGAVTLDLSRSCAAANGKTVELTKNEMRILGLAHAPFPRNRLARGPHARALGLRRLCR